MHVLFQLIDPRESVSFWIGAIVDQNKSGLTWITDKNYQDVEDYKMYVNQIYNAPDQMFQIGTILWIQSTI